jgi:hypothetical protein
MLTGRTTNNTERARPLLFDACRCGPGRRLACLACARWLRHYRQITERRAAFGSSP